MTLKKDSLLKHRVKHIDITAPFSWSSWMDGMRQSAYQSRNLANAARIYVDMLADRDCSIILCLAGSLISAGLQKIIVDLLKKNMVDVIVSTGANIVDQDFFEALGFSHYLGSPKLDDEQLRSLEIDRIYDTLIEESDLRVCDHTITKIADDLKPRPYSSREFIAFMGSYLREKGLGTDSIVRTAYEKAIPIFVPAFSDCSAGFGLVMHQVSHPDLHVSIDSVKDFRELTQLKIQAKETGLLMLGGGVPKNFAQDIVVAAELLGKEAPLHKYAVQITVADERDGGLSGSTLREACSWGKVACTAEQMVFSEVTLAFPMLAAYAYHNLREQRDEKRFNDFFESCHTRDIHSAVAR